MNFKACKCKSGIWGDACKAVFCIFAAKSVFYLTDDGHEQPPMSTEAGRWVAVPGTSEHQTGLAVDLVSASYQVLNRKQEQTKEQKWLMEHCWEYGFILRFPSDKSDVTGIGYEPWHYRYVGKETALAMRDSGLCLEEYLTALESTQKNVQDVHTQENQAVEKPGNVGKREGRV